MQKSSIIDVWQVTKYAFETFRVWFPDLSVCRGFQEFVYTWNSIPGWNSCQNEIIPVFVKCFLLFTRFHQDEISSREEKEKKMCKHFIPGWHFTMSMFFKNFLMHVLNMLSNFNMFEPRTFKYNESYKKYIMGPCYKKWSPKREKINTANKNRKYKNINNIFFVKFAKDWNFLLFLSLL